MSDLFNRLVILRGEYFNEYSDEQLSIFNRVLDPKKDYSSDELIRMMKNYSDLFNLRGIIEEYEELVKKSDEVIVDEDKCDSLVNTIADGVSYTYEELDYIYNQLGELKHRGHF